ncbi:hypothetical protein COV24_04730 [candidate division WWE3 bacterium CG10_big_fil_rev_8_21_14_0_10_32_10]|uniref:Uncharacterized protein n=1 Tax=candidate division WWE3 bacterium CG10_big_fil_rev_8_21_14_0_10_32_10 TaxID=1975090 RepID=A0A2H0RB57_UNCKA|nr:MAG: hypothetical protein COV24_04730 [candidate division WWE3 bacterium CG10_big_fil_rev_8_21_14_0_10_32_10]
MKKLKTIFLSLIIVSFVLLPQISLAQGIKNAFGKDSPLENVAEKGAGFDKSVTIGTISGRVINTALSLVGLIFLILMVYAGYLWMTARGEEDKVNKAQSIIRSSIIGLVLVMSAYAITVLITTGLNK